MDGLILSSLTESQQADIELLFSKEAFTALLLQQNVRSGGMTIAFLQGNWDTFKVDSLRIFIEFRSTREFVESLNATFVIIIPRKFGTQDIKDYRPIILIGYVHKLLSNAMAIKLTSVISSLISNNSDTFIDGHQIVNVALIPNELVDLQIKC